MNSTRPSTGARLAGALVCDGATDDDLQLVTTAAATMNATAAFLTPRAKVIGAKVCTTEFHARGVNHPGASDVQGSSPAAEGLSATYSARSAMTGSTRVARRVGT